MNQITIKQGGQLSGKTANLTEYIAGQINENPRQLQIILKGETCKIKDLLKTDEQRTRQALQNVVFGLAEIYTTAKLTDGDGMTERARLSLAACIDLILNKFKTLSIDEIKEAFKMAAAGEIEANLSAYNGKFTPVMLGDVLKAYKAKRNKILSKFESKQILLLSRQPDHERHEKNAQTVQQCKEMYFDMIDRVKNGEEIKRDEIKLYFAEICAKNGLLSVSADKKAELYQAAKDKAVNGVKNEIMSKATPEGDRISLKKQLVEVLRIVGQGKEVPDFEIIKERARVIYAKDLILESIKNAVGT